MIDIPATRMKHRFVAWSIAATLGAFVAFAGFEIWIASIGSESETTMAQIRGDQRFLSLPTDWRTADREIERRLSGLRMDAEPAVLGTALLHQLELIGGRRSLTVMNVRLNPVSSTPLRGDRGFEAHRYKVVVQGSYRESLMALAELAKAPLVLRTDRIAFERVRGNVNSHTIQATIDLAVVSSPRASRTDGPAHTP
jgi:hypothetical protein